MSKAQAASIKPVTTFLSDLIDDFLVDTKAAAEARASGHPRGPVTGLHRVDEMLGGYLATGVHILQAAPGAGKTAFALQMAARAGCPALFVSAEMGRLELFRRLIARETGTFLSRLKTGELGIKEAARLALVTAEKLPHLAIMDATYGFAAPELISDAANALRARAEGEHVLVLIDSLQVWARSVRGDFAGVQPATEYDLVNAALGGAKRVADLLPCPVVLISQRNRQGQKDGGLHSAKGSGDVEYIAETVIELNRERDERPDPAGEVRVTLALHKNRHGVPGATVPLRFCGRVQDFREEK